jgi:DNA-binding XRE family transcriptional regulator
MNNDLIHRHLKSIMAMRDISQAEIARQITKKLNKTKPISRQMVNHVFKGRVKSKVLRESICALLGIESKDIWA